MEKQNSKILFDKLRKELESTFEEREARFLAFVVLEEILELSKAAIMTAKEIAVSETQEKSLQRVILQLVNQEPYQYVFSKAEFFGNTFYVNSNVLIPRPETEELVSLVLEESLKVSVPKIIDLGTGSGCIPISLKKKQPLAEVWAVDISAEALEVSTRNASDLKADVIFKLDNILEMNAKYPVFDFIVSNPPYIPEKEKEIMDENVLAHEPHLALFVPDENPLKFYRAVLEFSKFHLTPNGIVFLEIHEDFSEEMKKLALDFDFQDVTVLEDLQGKCRMMKLKNN